MDEALADTAYTALWTRNATKMGWCQHCRWSKSIGWHLKTNDKSLIRKVFALLMSRGHFLQLRLCKGSHPHYLFVPEAIVDPEAKRKATAYFRWFNNWHKGWKADWLAHSDGRDSSLPSTAHSGQTESGTSPCINSEPQRKQGTEASQIQS